MTKVISQVTDISHFLEDIPFEGNPQFHALCVHGLNQNPDSLKPLLNDLSNQGIKSYLLHLPGHVDPRLDPSIINKDLVFDVYKKTYEDISKRAGDAPLGFLGYSFGGLIGTTLLSECHYDKMVLLAPALKVRPFIHGLRPLLPLLSRIFSVPLGNHKMERRYRFHSNGVPREVYRSFFDIYDYFHREADVPTHKAQGLVYAHPRDELINYGKLKKWLAANSPWELKRVSNKKAEFGRYRHLLFDETTLGKDSYANMLQEVSTFFLP